jgi:hypothetical protein
LHIDATSTDDDNLESLPNIWEDENVSRMVREVLARDLKREFESKQTKRQYKRDIHSSMSPVLDTATTASVASAKAVQTTRRQIVTTQKGGKKPVKVTQQAGNKNKNRVTIATKATKATVKPSMKPSNVVNTNANLGNFNASSKTKVSEKSTRNALCMQATAK